MIGATTNQEFRSHIQKDPALERRFGRVQIDEPTPEQARGILEGLAPRYERYHGVLIPPEAWTTRWSCRCGICRGAACPTRHRPDGRGLRRRPHPRRKRGPHRPRPGPGEDMARVVARASGIPAERVGEAERERLALLECRLAQEGGGPGQGRGRRGRRHPPQPHKGWGSPAAPSGRCCFWAPPAWARPPSRRRWPAAVWQRQGPAQVRYVRVPGRPTPWPGCWARPRGIWATTRAAS